MTQSQHLSQWADSAASDFSVVARDFVVATADGADLRYFSPLCGVLRRLRNSLGIEAAFIAEAVCGETVVRQIQRSQPVECDSLHVLFGHSLLGAKTAEGRQFGFAAVPVVTRDQLHHGTLCCRGAVERQVPQREVMDAVAKLIAKWFEQATVSMSGFAPIGAITSMAPLEA
jgi:hypothetical protein